MKNLPLILVTILFLSIFTSCKNRGCPPDEKVGKFNLTDLNKSYNPYSGTEKLIFKNSNGDSLTLKANEGKAVTRDQICIEEICTEPKIKGNTTCKYIASETHRFLFRDDNQTMLIDLLFGTDNTQKNAQKFYSFIRLGFSKGNYITSAGKITDVHFTGSFDEEATILNNFLIEKNSIELNGKTFNNVYTFEEEPLKYYYTKDQGLVGFSDPDGTWHLDRVE